MENDTRSGINRTGIQMAPRQGPNQVEFAQARPASPEAGGARSLADARAEYIRAATRVGSVPLPATAKGVVKTLLDKVTGKHPAILIDRLGERLAYERSGVRLYQAAVTKVEAAGHAREGELLTDLLAICREEAQHFAMLADVLCNMGADPTAQTPFTDVMGVATMGLMQVITDPRTTVAQTLSALLTAEQTDHASWELLIELARRTGHEALVMPFQEALEAEENHLLLIHRWLRETVLSEAA